MHRQKFKGSKKMFNTVVIPSYKSFKTLNITFIKLCHRWPPDLDLLINKAPKKL